MQTVATRCVTIRGLLLSINTLNSVVRYIATERPISIQGNFFLYGNDLMAGFANVTAPTRRSVLDTANPLPFGQLTNFYVYVSPAAGQPTTPNRQIQLQIWRLVGASNDYRLVWQQPALVNTSSPTGALLTVSTGLLGLLST